MLLNLIFKIIPYGSPDYEEAVRLREEILRAPLGQTFSQDELRLEKEHIHIVGLLGGQVMATAVLVPENHVYKMQRVAVAADKQASGIGSQLLKFCESYARENGLVKIYCHARDSAVNFYDRNGYQAEGEYFDEDSIPHLKMYKDL